MIIHTETGSLRVNQILPPVFFFFFFGPEVVPFGASVTVAFSRVLVEQVTKKKSKSCLEYTNQWWLFSWCVVTILYRSPQKRDYMLGKGSHHLFMISLAREGLTHVVRGWHHIEKLQETTRVQPPHLSPLLSQVTLTQLSWVHLTWFQKCPKGVFCCRLGRADWYGYVLFSRYLHDCSRRCPCTNWSRKKKWPDYQIDSYNQLIRLLIFI